MSKRYEELDSLRGLASISVVIHHCLLVLPIFLAAHYHEKLTDQNRFVSIFSNSPLHVIWGGHEAVLLFFILSGFVLTLLFLNNKPNYGSYVISRVCRIYLPYIFSIVLSTIILYALKDGKELNLSNWFNGMWDHHLSYKEVISYVFMLGYDTHNINTVTWSLIYEMRISIFFPVLIYLINKYAWKASLFIGLFTFTLLWVLLQLTSGLLSDSVTLSFLSSSFSMTFYYSSFFLIGSLLAKYKKHLSIFFQNLNIKIKWLLCILVLMFYTFEWWFPKVGYLKYNGNTVSKVLSSTGVDYVIAASVIILFVLALNSKKLSKILHANPLLFLGKISYSLYLIHPIILLTMVYSMKEILPPVFIVSFVPFISVLAAIFMYYFIEKPSIKLGRKLSGKKPKWHIENKKSA